MALKRFWVIAYRDLVRNKRRTLLTLLAVALGMMVLIMMSGLLAGIIAGGLRDNIRLNTGHLQLRDDTYEIEKLSLLSRDLLQDSDILVSQAEALSEVQSAAPVLWSSGVLSTVRESTGLQVTGIDSNDDFHAPVREGIVEGDYLTADGRGQVLIGKRLADDMDITVGQRVSLTMGGADGQVNEDIFTVVGLFNTGILNYDQNTVIMPLAQAQAFSNSGSRTSSIIVMLNDREDTAKVAAALQAPGISVLTWEDLNALLLTLMEQAGGFYYILYIIVILVVAVLIANTLLMSVFERTRELGILASLGMKGRQIMLMVLFEAIILALLGVAAGLVLGAGLIAYLARVGIEFSADAMGAIEGMALGSKMYPAFAPADALVLSLLMFFIVSLVSIYPAWYAARIEPVKALHAL
ncbi:MAG: FtsX-like permease family protein [Chloroflexi bacterium]|jgi:ABC-type lipoprotein release transport system permease subunit|nr:FtsX-like permease family protein [Chloroflexota bacterium]